MTENLDKEIYHNYVLDTITCGDDYYNNYQMGFLAGMKYKELLESETKQVPALFKPKEKQGD